ncbi:MAG: SLC13 family permease [Planctomycetota bacterium]
MRSSVLSLWAIKRQGSSTHIDLIGCGLIVDPRGYVITSVPMTADIESLHAIDPEAVKHEAEILATDKSTRVTLLKIGAPDAPTSATFQPANLANSELLKEGNGVIALGAKRTPASWELTTKTGRVTDRQQSLVIKTERYRDLIQTDVPLNWENSGAPLINFKGEVVGLALPSVRPSGSPDFSYAVPINPCKYFLNRLPIPRWSSGPGGEVCTWLGAETIPNNPVIATHMSVPERHGELVNHIRNNSPADRAGLRRGDVITTVNKNAIRDRSTFDSMAPELCRNKKVSLRILRDGREKNLTVRWNKASYLPPSGGSLAEVVLVVLIFSLMYYFVYKNVLDRVVLFVLGAIAVAIIGHHLGFYDQHEVADSLLTKIDVLCFIVGMQLITGVLESAGALEFLAKKILLIAGGNTWRIMWLFCLITYAFSLVVNNLTTVMIVAPMVLSLSRYLECDPKPFLVSMIIASNLGGASTMVGDFPNMLIGAEVGLQFHQFTWYMLPICLLELFVLLVYLRVTRWSLFKSEPVEKSASSKSFSMRSSPRNLYRDFELVDSGFPELDNPANSTSDVDDVFGAVRQNLRRTIRNPEALKRGAVILAGVIAGFLVCDKLGCSPAVIALAGGAMALVLGGCEPVSVLQKVQIKDILFFSGLFVLAGAAEASGALNYMTEFLVHLSFGNVLILSLLLMWVGALVTCFLNAGPTTALFLPVVLSFQGAAPHNLYWWALSLGVCAGSSGTLAGATAGSVTATMLDKFVKKREALPETSGETSEGNNKRNKTLTFREYASMGIPIMLLFLFISTIYITVIYRW